MNFDEAFKHVQEGTATDEEKRYVADQLEAASRLLKDDVQLVNPPIAQADHDDIKKAKKKFKWRYIVIPVTVIICVVVAIGAILGGVFGSAAGYAKQNMKYGKSACIDMAIAKVVQDAGTFYGVEIDPSRVIVKRGDTHKDFQYNSFNIKNSYYCYYIELEANVVSPNGRFVELEYEIKVDTRRGDAVVIERDMDD